MKNTPNTESTAFYAPIVERIFDLMRANRISQTELAAAIGVRQPTISDWRQANNTPRLMTLCKIADYFHVSLDYLVNGTAEQSGANEDFNTVQALMSIDRVVEVGIDNVQDYLNKGYRIIGVRENIASDKCKEISFAVGICEDD